MRNCKAPTESRRCGGRWRVRRAQEGLAAVPVGGGGAWPYNEPTHEPHISDQAPPVWRAQEGPEGPEGLAAVPVGGGGAWPGFEPTRRAKLAARTARGRAAAHGHTEQPGPTSQAGRRPEHQRRHKHHRTEKPQNSS